MTEVPGPGAFKGFVLSLYVYRRCLPWSVSSKLSPKAAFLESWGAPPREISQTRVVTSSLHTPDSLYKQAGLPYPPTSSPSLSNEYGCDG